MEPPETLPYPLEIESPVSRLPSPVEQLLHDRALQAILISALLVNVALLVYILIRYDSLPDPLPLHFDSAGMPDVIKSKDGILVLPFVSFVVLGLDTVLGSMVHRQERAAALLLAGSAFLVQVLMWFATINIAGGIF